MYIDDILKYSAARTEHVSLVRKVLGRLLEHDLYAEKCLFFQQSVSFLGYRISISGVEMESDCIAANSHHSKGGAAVLRVCQLLPEVYPRFWSGSSSHYLTAEGGPVRVRVQWTAEANWTAESPEGSVYLGSHAGSSGSLFGVHSGGGHVRGWDRSRARVRHQRNYEVGDRDLLAVVKALKACRHWLDGAKHPFLIWTDHRNLEYIRGARRLNPRQARWAMLFTRFVFTLSYRQGSQNAKADALSLRYDTEERSIDHTPIFPASCLVAPVVWELDADIDRALRTTALQCRATFCLLSATI